MEDCAIAAKGGDEVDFGIVAQGRSREGEDGEAEVVSDLVGEGGLKNEGEGRVGGLYVPVAGRTSATADGSRSRRGGFALELLTSQT